MGKRDEPNGADWKLAEQLHQASDYPGADVFLPFTLLPCHERTALAYQAMYVRKHCTRLPSEYRKKRYDKMSAKVDFLRKENWRLMDRATQLDALLPGSPTVVRRLELLVETLQREIVKLKEAK